VTVLVPVTVAVVTVRSATVVGNSVDGDGGDGGGSDIHPRHPPRARLKDCGRDGEVPAFSLPVTPAFC